MRFGKLKLAFAFAWLAAALFVFVNRGAETPTPAATPAAAAAQVKEIEGYKAWAKVNETPMLMPGRVATACGLWVSKKGPVVDGAQNPHRQKYFTVYVNDLGREAMLGQKRPKFPVGSVIVKEKLPGPDGRAPELLTVMIKRERGFDAESGDWEYMVVNGDGTEVQGRGRLQNCQNCHFAYKENDYVFRTYLTPAAQNKLR